MTLSPLITYLVQGVPGKLYKVGPRCSAPGCNRVTEHAHHLWRRSKWGGGFNWVEIRETEDEPGLIVGNLTGLCVEHHHQVTVQETWIKFIDGVFVWGDNVGEEGVPIFRAVGPLDPQPPTPDRLDVSQPDHETESEDLCPTCGQHKRRRSPTSPPGERRPSKSWVVKVPADAEDGASILNAFIEDLAPLLGYDPTATARYYVVNAALVYVEQDRHAFIEAIAGIGGGKGEET